ncbi:MAG: hypothetical protein DRI40_08740 [Chloroflexi bacterium]|nr:MAG: hypothetical protein DRI40_08740 [Chloroflexota bacterium]
MDLEALGPFLLLFLAIIAIALPIGALIVLASLALFIWSAKRIWPYPRAIGKWVASGRNFFPLLVLVLIVFTAAFALAMLDPTAFLGLMFLPFAPIMMLAGEHLLAAFVLLVFMALVGLAMIVWVVRASRWLWRAYTRVFWGGIPWVWNTIWTRVPEQVERRPLPRAPAAKAKRVSLGAQARQYWDWVEVRLAAAIGFCASSALRIINWLQRTIGRAQGWLLAAAAALGGFLVRNALLLAFPLILAIGVALIAASMPFIPLYTVVILPYLLVSWVWRRLRRGEVSDSGTSPGAPTLLGVASLERRIQKSIDFVLRLLRLK